MRSSTTALSGLHHDLTLPVEHRRAALPALPLQREIRLTGIRYAYPSTPDKPVFDNFDLVIPACTTAAIVGKSGAGKSTLMDILLGLLQPQAGTFTVDGVEITPENIGAWQKSIGYVPQHIYLADASIAENIAFGVPRDKIDMRAVERAASAAQIHDFVVGELSLRYDTRIGDRGIRLSGGQRQRIGVARALYHNPTVLLMDEATSALDSATEDALHEAIKRLSANKTVIVITHSKKNIHIFSHRITL